MKTSHLIGVIVAAATILLAVTGALTYLLYLISREKAYHEKWEDYIDCGLALVIKTALGKSSGLFYCAGHNKTRRGSPAAGGL